MHIKILSVGKFKGDPEEQIFARYLARIQWKINLLEIKPSELQKSEDDSFLNHLEKFQGVVIAFDSYAKQYSSKDFAHFLQNLQDNSNKDICFLIGGARGLSQQILDKADYKISFGAATWPHLLFRSMLAEQLYRSQCILNNHPYA